MLEKKGREGKRTEQTYAPQGSRSPLAPAPQPHLQSGETVTITAVVSTEEKNELREVHHLNPGPHTLSGTTDWHPDTRSLIPSTLPIADN